GQSFRPSLAAFVRDLFTFRIRASEITAEATAQIRRLQNAGLRVSHIDTHKHTHLFSGILRPLLAAAGACEVPAIRNPFEPAWALRATPGSKSASFRLRRFAVKALRSQHRAFQRAVRTSGVATTSGTIGVLATGAPDVEQTLRDLLSAIPSDPSRTWELVCHPGYPDAHLDQVHTRLRASRAQEHAALLKLLPAIPLASWRDLESSAAANQLH
ncbi:MAG: ChbG/HpnK family deacetylase, partial [Acidobacteriaceae bacterium]